MKVEKLKLEQKLNYEKQIEEGRKLQSKESTAISAKLPKLVITKFKGTDLAEILGSIRSGN